MNTNQLKQQIGQRLIVGLPGTTISPDFITLVKEYKVANIILFRHNIVNNQQISQLCASIQALVFQHTGTYAFITIDQEGGVVTRLSQDATNIPGAMAIAATGNTENAYKAAFLTGKELKSLGINFNLAPDLDINSDPRNPVIGSRSFGDTPETVIKYALPMVKGFLDANILACGKHFPGHGDTYVDSHLDLPIVDKSLADLQSNELQPFAAAIAEDIPAIMSSHIYFPQLVSLKKPATIAREIMTDLLKTQMGFKGLLISDCMEMKAIANTIGTAQGVIEAFKAGVDMVFLSHTSSLAVQVYDLASQALDTGELDPKEFEESITKILYFKKRYALPGEINLEVPGCKTHREIAKKIMEESITLVNPPSHGKFQLGICPLFISCPDYRVTNASNAETSIPTFAEYMAQNCNGNAWVTSEDPTDTEITSILQHIDQLLQENKLTSLVLGTYNGHVKLGQLKLAKALEKLSLPLTVVALRNPYDLKDLSPATAAFVVYEYSKMSMDGAIQVLKNESLAPGKLSVRL